MEKNMNNSIQRGLSVGQSADFHYKMLPANSLYCLYWYEPANDVEPPRLHYVTQLSKYYSKAVQKAYDYMEGRDERITICPETELTEYNTDTTGEKGRVIQYAKDLIGEDIATEMSELAENTLIDEYLELTRRLSELTGYDDYYDVWQMIKSQKVSDKDAERLIELEAMRNSFNWIFRDFYGKAFVKGRDLSQKQWDFFSSIVHDFKDNYKKKVEEKIVKYRNIRLDQLTSSPVPETDKRITIKGEITSYKVKETDWGLTTKILITTDEGYKLYGSLPKSLEDCERYDDLIGQQIQFDCSVIKSDRDEYFGFYKRPTKIVA